MEALLPTSPAVEARWHYVLHVVGCAWKVSIFWKRDLEQVSHFASALAVGVGLFVYNILRMLRRIPRWNVVAAGIASSLVWLTLTVAAGLYLAVAKCWQFSPLALRPALERNL